MKIRHLKCTLPPKHSLSHCNGGKKNPSSPHRRKRKATFQTDCDCSTENWTKQYLNMLQSNADENPGEVRKSVWIDLYCLQQMADVNNNKKIAA